MQLDQNRMIVLPSHEFFESLLKPRGNRPNQDWSETHTYDPYVIVCFYADWCGPCKKLDKKFLVDCTPKIKWYSCNIDENDTTLGYCGLQSIPSFALIKNGMFCGRRAGAGAVDELLDWLAENGFPVSDT